MSNRYSGAPRGDNPLSPVTFRPPVDGTFIWTPSHVQRLRCLPVVGFNGVRLDARVSDGWLIELARRRTPRAGWGVAMHKDQLALDVGAVRRLVDEQFPRWRALPIRRVPAAGTVNAIFRLGEDLAARFPLRPQEERRVRDWLRAEAAAMQEFADVSLGACARPVAVR